MKTNYVAITVLNICSNRLFIIYKLPHFANVCRVMAASLTFSTVFFKKFLIISLALSISNGLLAADFTHGKLLHDENCVRCHQSEVYTREKRMVNSYEQLVERIRQCELMAEMAWFDEEIQDVSAYLDNTYYHFSDVK